MKIRQLEALPAVGMPFGTALPGGEQALDRAGNPYGTDKWATFLNASEEFGDVFIDMAITAIPYVGPALTLALGTAEGQADAQRRIEDEVKKGIKDGSLNDNIGWQTMLADAGGDVQKATDKLTSKLFKYTLAAGGLEGVGDYIVAKPLSAPRYKNHRGYIH